MQFFPFNFLYSTYILFVNSVPSSTYQINVISKYPLVFPFYIRFKNPPAITFQGNYLPTLSLPHYITELCVIYKEHKPRIPVSHLRCGYGIKINREVKGLVEFNIISGNQPVCQEMFFVRGFSPFTSFPHFSYMPSLHMFCPHACHFREWYVYV